MGRISCQMATMLALIATDAPIPPTELRRMLGHAVDRSFHEISVDGDTSTNDAVILWGGPEAQPPLTPTSLEAIGRAVTRVSQELAEQIIADGEGRSRTMEIVVTGGQSDRAARAVARSIATSALVKTALAGGDPNWGRILAAAGNAGVLLNLATLALHIDGVEVFARGGPRPIDAEDLGRRFSADRVRVVLDLADGAATGRMLTTDLTHRYVEINAEYTT